jgi:hypothetical protein
LLRNIVKHVERKTHQQGSRSPHACDSAGACGQTGAMLDKSIQPHGVDASFYTMLIDAIKDTFKTKLRQPVSDTLRCHGCFLL